MQAGGLLLALGVLVGAGVGIAHQEPSLGAVIGLVAGLLMAFLFTLVERWRAGR